MRRVAWPLLLAALAAAGLACNLQRVLDPSLPTSTPEPTQTPLASPTPVPTVVPTLSPQARVEAGDKAFIYGDWTGALREYERTLTDSDDPELTAAALLGIGRVYIEQDNFTEARSTLESLLAQYADADAAAGAYVALASVYSEFGDNVGAAQAFQSYADLRPGLLDAYVHEQRGDLLLAAGAYAEAIAAYEASNAAPRLGDAFRVRVKIGNAHAAAGDHAAAIATYQAIFDETANDFLRADMDLLIGRQYKAMDDDATAYTYFQHAVASYPLAFSSYAALVELVNADEPVDEFQRGLIDYYAATNTEAGTCEVSSEGAKELYIVAIAAFDRYLQTAPPDHTDAAHYYRALSLAAMGDYPAAISEWNHMRAEHAFDTYWVDAFRDMAYVQWLCQEDYDGAISTLLNFVASTPSQPASAEFLYLAGRIAERGGRLTRSVEIWPRVADEYPASEYAFDSIFNAGISSFRLENYSQAQSFFLRAFQSALSLEQNAKSQFWVGKALQAVGETDQANSAWQRAAAADPTGYYSERASDLLAGETPFQPPAAFSFEFDADAKKAEAEAWIVSTFDIDPNTDFSTPNKFIGDPRFQRGTEFWLLGEYERARAEFEDLRLSLVADPVGSYQLANYTLELGLYRTAVFAAREVLNMAGMSDAGTFNAPKYFNYIRFGAYYSDLVVPETAGEGLDPLFFYSMMRQESLFEGFVTSVAGARGLMQVIPSTGQQIADLTGWPPDFDADDLYRPYVSIRFGADYLAIQRNAFDNDMYKALAAYNAGPGNASYWQGLAADDPDLYLEVITFAETRNHIRSIYELFTIYKNLYATQ
jgi:soluble lytic murein transglycosylase